MLPVKEKRNKLTFIVLYILLNDFLNSSAFVNIKQTLRYKLADSYSYKLVDSFAG